MMLDGPFHWLPAAAPWLALAVLTAVVALLIAADDRSQRLATDKAWRDGFEGGCKATLLYVLAMLLAMLWYVL